MVAIHLIFTMVLLISPSIYSRVPSSTSSSYYSASSTFWKAFYSVSEIIGTCTWLYRENPNDCGSYFQCLNGVSVARRCPKKLSWNPEGSYCDWSYRSGCKAKTANGKKPTRNKKPSPTSLSTISTKALRCMEGAYLCHPNPECCNKYIQCGTSGKMIVFECGPGLLWDDTIKTCNWPYAVTCNCKWETSSTNNSTTYPEMEITTTTTTTSTTTTTTTTTTTPPPLTLPTTTIPTTTTSMPPETALPMAPSTTTTTTTTPAPTTTTSFPPETTLPTAPPTIITTSTTTLAPSTSTTTNENPTISPSSSAPQSGYKLVCYYAGAAIYRPNGGTFRPSDIDPSLCTHLIYAFGCMNENTYKLEMCDPWIEGKSGKNIYGQVTALKKFGIKVMIAIGGWNDSIKPKWGEMLKDPVKMRTFINSICDFLITHDFDGVDIDYEYPCCPQAICSYFASFEKAAFVALIKGLRQTCLSSTILSAAVSPNENIVMQAYDVPSLLKYLDWINIMAYDFHGAWETTTGINAPLDQRNGDQQYLNAYHAIQTYIGLGALPQKICLGIPMYGQSFKLADVRDHGIGAKCSGPGSPGDYTKQNGILSYYEICSNTKWTETVTDPEQHVGPYRYDANTGQWVSYDNRDMVRHKVKRIKKMGLGGAMVWSMDLDDFGNMCGLGTFPLLSALKNVLLGATDTRQKVISNYNEPINRNFSSSRSIQHYRSRRKQTKLRRRKVVNS